MDILVQIRSILPILSCFLCFFSTCLYFLMYIRKCTSFYDLCQKVFLVFLCFFSSCFYFLTKLYSILLFIIYIKKYEQDLKKHGKIRQKREDGPHLNQHVHLDREEYEEFFFPHFIFVYIIIWIF